MSPERKGWKEIPLAGVCWKPATDYQTGDWRTFKPIYDSTKCTRCMLCHILCPDAAIEWNKKENEMEFDDDFCKGCGICADECPASAIEMKREEGP